MMYNIRERRKTYLTEAQIFMAVFFGASGIFAVINMEYGNLFFADDLVKLVDNAVKIADDVITAVVGMAGVKAYAELIIICDPVIDARQLLKGTPDFRTLSGHCLKCDI